MSRAESSKKPFSRAWWLDFTNDEEVFSRKTFFGGKSYIVGTVHHLILDEDCWEHKAIKKAYLQGVQDGKN